MADFHTINSSKTCGALFMKTPTKFHPGLWLLILALIAAACAANETPAPTAAPRATSPASVADAPIALLPSETPLPSATLAIAAEISTAASAATPTAPPIPSRTPDPGLITAGNAARLRVLRRMGIGGLQGTPRYSPDGRWLAVSTTTGVYLYDTAASFAPRFLTPVHSEALAFSPDGRALAVGSQLISVEDGQALAAFSLPGVPADGDVSILDLAFSPDGQWCAVSFFFYAAQTDQEVTGVFQAVDGRWLKTFPGASVHFSADGRFLLTRLAGSVSAPDPRLRIYDLQTDQMLYEWPGERGDLLPDSRAYVESQGAVRIYDLTSGRVLQAFDGQFAAASADGQRLALLSVGRIYLYQVADGTRVATLEGDFTGVNQVSLSFAPGQQAIAAAASEVGCCGLTQNASFSLWRSDGSLIQRFAGGSLPVTRFAFSPDGQALLFDRLQSNDLQIWRTADGADWATLDGFTAPVTELAFLPGGQQLVAATYGSVLNPLLFYQVDTGQLDRLYPTNANAPDYGLAVRPDGQVVAHSNTFWRLSDGQLLPELSAKMVEVYSYAAIGVAFSPDGRWLATGALGGNLQIWDFDAQALLWNQTVCGVEEIVGSLSWSADGQRLASACTSVLGAGSPVVQVYEVGAAGGQFQQSLQGAPGSAFSRVLYSSDGRYLAAAGVPYSAETYQSCSPGSSSQAQVWDAASGQPLVAMPTGCVESLAFSPDGQLLALGLWDGGIEIWRLPEGEKAASLPDGRNNRVNALAFGPDGDLLAAGYEDGSLKLWRVEP